MVTVGEAYPTGGPMTNRVFTNVYDGANRLLSESVASTVPTVTGRQPHQQERRGRPHPPGPFGSIQAVATPGNTTTVGGVATTSVLGANQLPNYTPGPHAGLQLRADSSTTFGGTVTFKTNSSTPFTFGVDRTDTGAATNQVLSITDDFIFKNAGSITNTRLVNFTGGHGFSLAMGTVSVESTSNNIPCQFTPVSSPGGSASASLSPREQVARSSLENIRLSLRRGYLSVI